VRELLVAVASIVGLSGCYPVLRTERPKVEVRVRDEHGHPIEDATFTLATYRYPFPTPSATTFLRGRTDAAGVVSLPKKRKWQLEILLPDGSAWYSWRSCIEKPGYRAVASAESKFEGPIEIVLKASAVSSSCKWPGENDAYYDVRVVE